jgi:hypothetical protein
MSTPCMRKFWAAIPMLLSFGSALAQTPPEPPVESNGLGLIVFGILFIGFCAIVGWVVWKNEKTDKKKIDEKGQARPKT